MSVGRFIRRAIIAFIAVAGLLVAVAAIIVLTGVTIPLDALRQPVAEAAADTLGRKVDIAGSVSIVATLWPTIQVEGVHIANPEAWDGGEFARLERVRVQLGIGPLLRGEIHIAEIMAEGMSVSLASTADGRQNWRFGAGEVREPGKVPKGQEPEHSGVVLVALDEVALRGIEVSYHDAALGQTYTLVLDELTGSARSDEAVDARIRGSIEDKPYRFSLQGGAVSELLTRTQPWSVALTGDVAGSPVRLQGRRKPAVPVPEWVLEVGIEQVDIGGLLSWLELVEGAEAAAEQIDLRAHMRGESLHEALEESELRASLAGASWTLRDPGTQETATIRVREGVLGVEAGKPWAVQLDGVLEDAPVAITMRGAPLIELAQAAGALPFELDARVGGGQLKLEGAVTLPVSLADLALTASLTGEQLDGLGQLLGTEMPQLGTYALGGQLRVEEDGYHLTDLRVRVKDSELSGEFHLQTAGTPRPRFDVKLAASRLQLDDFDVGDWSPLGPSTTVSPEQINEEARAAGPAQDEQVEELLSPEVLGRVDGHATVRVEQVLAGNRSYGGGSLDMTLEEGRLALDPLRLDTPVGAMTAGLTLTPVNEEVGAALDITITRADIGGLLAWLHLAEGVEVTADRIELRGRGRGASLPALLESSQLNATLGRAQWTLRDPGTQATATVRVEKGSLAAAPGQLVTINLDGFLESTPIKLELRGARLPELAKGPDRAPLALTARVGGARLDMEGDVALPVSRRTLQVAATVSGERLNGLNELLELDLPPLGPYTLGGQFRMDDDGYHVSDFRVHVGESELTGEFALRTRGGVPRFDAKLTAPRLQLNDFATGDWTPVEHRRGRREGAAEAQPAGADVSAERHVAELLSAEALRRFNGRLMVKVDEVLSGGDSLGGGDMVATLLAGRLAVEPLTVNIPGGAMTLNFALQPGDSDMWGQVRAHVERFDYGVLARRVKPESTMNGSFSLDVDLVSQAPGFDELMQYADGHFDFGIWPGNFEADVFELWAVSLASAVLPRLDSEKKSTVNCFVLRLNMEEGIMTNEALLVDTTRMQVGGDARIDFKEETIELHLRPEAKRPQFFSLATPITVKGDFADFAVGVKAGDLIGSVIQLLSSPVHVPIRRLVTPSAQFPPADGRAACEAAMHRPSQ